MRKRLIYFVQVFVGIVLVLLGPNAQAVRMGTLSVESALGEPLKASIRLYELGEVVIGRTTVSMASPSTYDSLGLIYNDLISRINLQYEDEGNGSLIRLSTKDPVNEVVLDLQVEFVGPEGKVSKTYVAFIDPPFLIDERLSSFALESELLSIEESTEELLIEKDIDVLELVDGPEAIEVEAEPVIDDLVQRTESISSTPGSIDEMGSDATQASVYGRQIIVRTGDTLTKIAQREKLSDFSIEQMLVGVFRKNREAFVGDNMNRLRAGNVIRIPIEDELETISANEATSEIKIHMAEWRVYKDNLAARSSVQLQTTIEQADRTKSGVVETAPNQVNVKPQAENAYVVEVSKGTASGDLGSQGLEERLLATEKALAEQKTRADELEKIIADLTSLAQSKQDLGSAIQPEREQAVGVPITVVRENIERPWQAKIIEAVLHQPLYLLVPILVLLIMGLWVSKRLNRMNENGGGDDGTQPVVETRTVVSSSESSSSESTALNERGEANVSPNQDPVEDADIFLAYGRYPQAEKILKEALALEPDRLDVLLKLAQVYSHQKELASFDTVAETIANVTSKAGAYWERLVALGYLINPTDERYAEGKFASERQASMKPVDLSSIDLDLGNHSSPKS